MRPWNVAGRLWAFWSTFSRLGEEAKEVYDVSKWQNRWTSPYVVWIARCPTPQSREQDIAQKKTERSAGGSLPNRREETLHD